MRFGIPLPPLPGPAVGAAEVNTLLAKDLHSIDKLAKKSAKGLKNASSKQILLKSKSNLSAPSKANLAKISTQSTQNIKGSTGNLLAPKSVKGSDFGSTSILKSRGSRLNLIDTEEIKESDIIVEYYKSRYRFTPTITLERAEGDDEDEISRLQVRGYTLSLNMMNVLSIIIPACSNLVNVCFWNCGLRDAHFSSILQTVTAAAVNTLSIDCNPNVSELNFASLLNDELQLKNLSLRSNRISDIGGKAIGLALKSNHTMLSLNLFDNKIGIDAVEAIAEGLKVNSTLVSLSMAKNDLRSDSVALLARALCNVKLNEEELMLRKKQVLDLEKKEVEEVAVVDIKKGAKPPRAGRIGSAKTEKDKKDDKKNSPVKATAKKPEPARNAKTPDEPKSKKVDDKKGKDQKKGAPLSAVKSAKKGKDELKDEAEEAAEMKDILEPMFEVNGIAYVLGNRGLSSLNISANNIDDAGLKAIMDAVQEQETTADQAPEGMLGLFRLAIQVITCLISITQMSLMEACYTS